MEDENSTPYQLMPRWWQIGSNTVLMAAYMLWLVPIAQFIWGGAGFGGAFAWLLGILAFQFFLAKFVKLVEFFATAKQLEQSRAREGEPHFGDIK
ncbi:hypothetical protein [uncultured Sulfitobacter sp.]|uniref:hypothetical protein n=1 Tax=uncultured Sulfitobacter sp. TaxID=191468 RepID=UPI002633C46C|nr:hypothetical protein [uncultured Sulfitobacter sp.]